jgi:hypothetical protein
MKCKKSTGDCTLSIKFLENGDAFEYCTVCSFSYLHKFDNIKTHQLNQNKKEN